MLLSRRSLLKALPLSFVRWQAIPFHPGKRKRARELGIRIGLMKPGRWNGITDVPGVLVGHATLIRGDGKLKVGEGPVRTGVTIVIPHAGISEQYLPFSYHIANGNGEVTGLTQADMLGVLGSPICLTNTSSVGMVYDSMLSLLPKQNNEGLMPIVGETWDAFLNDIEGRHVKTEDVVHAVENASSGAVQEGNVGGGTGMICYGFKGGIGTASRKLETPWEKYTVGVLVQANHGIRENLRIDGVPVGEEITDLRPKPDQAANYNSILIVIATDAPLLDYQLNRVAFRASLGLAKTGSISSNSSGDFSVAFSTSNRISRSDFWNGKSYEQQSIEQYQINTVFQAVSEATEEAIINALFMAEDMEGRDGNRVYALPVDRVLKIMERHRRLFRKEERKVAAL